MRCARCPNMWSQQIENRTGLTTITMDLDKVLILLSLREEQGNMYQEDVDMDDAMDVDSMDIDSIHDVEDNEPTTPEPIKSSTVEETKQELHSPLDNSFTEEGEVLERLLVKLLSPTNLGARYAINQHNKHIQKNTQIEQHSQSPTPENLFYQTPRHQSSFTSGTDVFQRLHQQEPGPQRQFVPFPVQVHHHHYYYSGLSESISPEPRIRPQSHKVLEEAQDENIEEGKDTHLPLPWDKSSTPAEERAYMLSLYLQLAVNLVVLAYALHLVWSVVAAIKKDVTHKLSRHANNLLVEIALCERSYRENHCSPDEIVPALEQMCAYWEQCMRQDPTRGGNVSSLGAQTIGMVLTSLVEPLSFKALAVFAGAVLLVYVYNFGFGYVRARTYWG